jgi:hypothetical protein
MTRGVLLFAQNNQDIDYVAIANLAAIKVKEHLGVSVSVVTNDPVADHYVFDQVIPVYDNTLSAKYFYDGTTSKKLHWKNSSRVQCFNLSPYDETLVIDVDYILNSSTLNYCWNQPRDFLIYQKSFDLAPWRDAAEFKYVSDFSIPFYWATVFFFRKTVVTESFFTIVDDIKSNWSYYKSLYRIHSTTFRNDLAFSIALHMMNGMAADSFAGHMPGKMFYTLGQDLLLDMNSNKMKFLVQRKDDTSSYIPLVTTGIDVHVMNKMSLMRCINV